MTHLARSTLVLASVAACACASRPEVPFRSETRFEHETQEVEVEELSALWVSYQIEVLGIDGVQTDYRPIEPCIYYCVDLVPGTHTLTIRLNYEAPLARVATATAVDEFVLLEPGRSYRLLNLSAGDERNPSFMPCLIEGAPADELVELDLVPPR